MELSAIVRKEGRKGLRKRGRKGKNYDDPQPRPTATATGKKGCFPPSASRRPGRLKSHPAEKFYQKRLRSE